MHLSGVKSTVILIEFGYQDEFKPQTQGDKHAFKQRATGAI